MDARGRRPAREFFEALSTTDKAKVFALLQKMADFGVITNREHFKKLDDHLFEFKRFQTRLLGDYRPGRQFVIAHGVRKQKDKLQPEDLRTASRILGEHDQRERKV
jgi:hypothetical protein